MSRKIKRMTRKEVVEDLKRTRGLLEISLASERQMEQQVLHQDAELRATNVELETKVEELRTMATARMLKKSST